MEIKEVVEELRHYVECHLFCCVEFSVVKGALDHLERQEAEIAELKQQLSEKQTEWISVEDRLPEKKDELCLVYRKNGSIGLSVHYCETNHYWSYGDVTHWMPLPEPPKPKEPTFKDVFLEKFPNGLIELIQEKTCVNYFFRQFDAGNIKCDDCAACWDVPYFEEEEEGEADGK